MKYAIVAVGYNRPDSMQTLIESILYGRYGDDRVDLIVSIDKGENQDKIINVAENVDWKYGEKKVRAFPERIGLRKHIIECGNLTSEYDAVIVLEDDLIVSPFFYEYVKKAVERYKLDNKIAGISLYRHYMHPGVYRPFEPANCGYDVYFQQYAMSWGQCWTKSMWNDFKEWYEINQDCNFKEKVIIPDYIVNWNRHSWLKYYMRYIVEKNKYFVYPYISLSTNSSDVGQHCVIQNNDYQVPLLQGNKEYNFPDYKNAIKYDIYFERVFDESFYIDNIDGKILLDLYGNRSCYEDADYVISTKNLPYKKIKEIQLKFRPIEINCINQVGGKGIGIYYVKEKAKPRSNRIDIVTRYDIKSIHWKSIMRLSFNELKETILARIKRSKNG